MGQIDTAIGLILAIAGVMVGLVAGLLPTRTQRDLLKLMAIVVITIGVASIGGSAMLFAFSNGLLYALPLIAFLSLLPHQIRNDEGVTLYRQFFRRLTDKIDALYDTKERADSRSS